MASAPEPRGREGPAIVIFSAAVRPDGTASTVLRRRVQAAAACGTRHAGATFVPTGGRGRFGPSEALVMAGLLAEFGVTVERITLEETATDTLSSVRAVRRMLRGHPGRVYAATSAYHLPRCLLLLRLAGVPASACPPPAFPASGRFALRWFWRLREAVAIPVDVALVLWLRARGRL